MFADFNMNRVKPEMGTFLNTENLTNLVKENTCFKVAGSRTCAYQGVRNVSFSENCAYVLNG